MINSATIGHALFYMAKAQDLELCSDDDISVLRHDNKDLLYFVLREGPFEGALTQVCDLSLVVLHRSLPQQQAAYLADLVADGAAKLRGKRLVKLLTEFESHPINVDEYADVDQVIAAAEHLMDLASKMRMSLDAHA